MGSERGAPAAAHERDISKGDGKLRELGFSGRRRGSDAEGTAGVVGGEDGRGGSSVKFMGDGESEGVAEG